MTRVPTASVVVLLMVVLGCTAAPAVSPAPTIEPTPSPQPATPTALPASPTAAPATPAAEPTAGASAVSIVDFGFNPATLDVSTGTQVTWTNTGAVAHTVTFDDDGPDSGVLEPGQTYQLTFETAGTFSYICTIHPAMTGTINVSD